MLSTNTGNTENIVITITNAYENLRLQNTLNTQMSQFNTALERLTSGFRINSAADDPAGQFVSSRFLTEVRGLEVVNKNIQSAVDLLSIADTTTEEIDGILNEIRDLVQTSCNEYLTAEEREKNQTKINELFNRALDAKNTAEYNGMTIFGSKIALDKTQTYTNNPVATAAAASETEAVAASTETPETEPSAATTEEDIVIVTDDGVDDGIMMVSEEDLEGYYDVAVVSADTDESGVMIISDEEDVPTTVEVSDPESTPATVADGDETVLTYSSGASITELIDGKTYTIKNKASSENTLTYSVENGVITFSGDNFSISAADGQEDNLYVIGASNGVYMNDGDDTIIYEGTYGVINSGEGDDKITYKGNDGHILGRDGNDTIKVIGDSNTIYGDTSGGVVATDNENITILGNDNTAYGSNGNDSFIISGSNNTAYGGDGDDAVTYHGDAGNVYGQDGDDTITYEGSHGYIYGGDGDSTITYQGDGGVIFGGKDADTITYQGDNGCISGYYGDDTITYQGNSGEISGSYGSDTIKVVGDSNMVYGASTSLVATDNESITILGNDNTAYGSNGDDSFIISGSNNTAYGGDEGYDTIQNTGENTYSQMSELQIGNSEFKIQTSTDPKIDGTYTIKFGSFLTASSIDISTAENATEALTQVDAMIKEVSNVRTNIGYQETMLEEMIETNLTKITNLNNSLSTVRDADTADEYNKLLATASLIDTTNLLMTQINQNQANILSQLIWGIAS